MVQTRRIREMCCVVNCIHLGDVLPVVAPRTSDRFVRPPRLVSSEGFVSSSPSLPSIPRRPSLAGITMDLKTENNDSDDWTKVRPSYHFLLAEDCYLSTVSAQTQLSTRSPMILFSRYSTSIDWMSWTLMTARGHGILSCSLQEMARHRIRGLRAVWTSDSSASMEHL